MAVAPEVTESDAGGVSIGIDLGTTSCRIGVWRQDSVEFIADGDGNRSIASVVAFLGNQRLVGDAARKEATVNPLSAVFDIKHIIGCRFYNRLLQLDMARFSCKIVENGDDQPSFRVRQKDVERRFSPEHILAMILSEMKAVAKRYLGTNVKSAVISVPACFGDSQRQATMDAGTIAGLNVTRVINESTAAAIAYAFDCKTDVKSKRKRTLLVFDLGGGALDVSLLTIDDTKIEVKATAGDSRLGGEDFDSRLVAYFAAELKRKHMIDIAENRHALRRLREACEIVKRALSTVDTASLEIPSLFKGFDFKSSITRTKFEELCVDLFMKTVVYVETVLNDSNIEKEKVHNILMVGGSSRIPKIQSLLAELFKGHELCKFVKIENAVAYGAAVQAAVLAGNLSEKVPQLQVLDVASKTIGLADVQRRMRSIFKRNTKIPAKIQKTLLNSSYKAQDLSMEVFEGEAGRVKANTLIGEFELANVPNVTEDSSTSEVVTFEVDANGILSVFAETKRSTGKASIAVTRDKGLLNKYQIATMSQDVTKYRARAEASWLHTHS